MLKKQKKLLASQTQQLKKQQDLQVGIKAVESDAKELSEAAQELGFPRWNDLKDSFGSMAMDTLPDMCPTGMPSCDETLWEMKSAFSKVAGIIKTWSTAREAFLKAVQALDSNDGKMAKTVAVVKRKPGEYSRELTAALDVVKDHVRQELDIAPGVPTTIQWSFVDKQTALLESLKMMKDTPRGQIKAQIKGYLTEVFQAQKEAAARGIFQSSKRDLGLSLLTCGPSANAIVPLLKSQARGVADDIMGDIEAAARDAPMGIAAVFYNNTCKVHASPEPACVSPPPLSDSHHQPPGPGSLPLSPPALGPYHPQPPPSLYGNCFLVWQHR